LAKVERKSPEPDLLSPLTVNEGLSGRWYTEFPNDESFRNRETLKWHSWDNRRSFWIQREYLIQAIYDVGFDSVLEQFDNLAPNIAENMRGFYRTTSRGTFIGIKTQLPPVDKIPSGHGDDE
jgi:hypothetical protein